MITGKATDARRTRASMAEMGAACVASAGAGFTQGHAPPR